MQETTLINRLELRFTPRIANEGSIYLVIEAYIDGEQLVGVDQYSIDVPFGLLPSVERNGYWYIVSCSCGDPGCAGIFSGVEVKHREGRITWHLLEPGPMRDFRFDADQYRGEVYRLIENGRMAIHWHHPRTDFRYRFSNYHNQRLFEGQYSDDELRSWWDSTTTSVLAPWRTRYEDDQED